MKRWQIEQILYLNSKDRLVFSHPQKSALQNLHTLNIKKENPILDSVRKFCTFLINVF